MRGLSTIAATMLLILVAVSASLLIYYWLSGASGSKLVEGNRVLYEEIKVEDVHVKNGYLYVSILNIGKVPLSLTNSMAILTLPGGASAGTVDLSPINNVKVLDPGKSVTLKGRLPPGLNSGTYNIEVVIEDISAYYRPMYLSGLRRSGPSKPIGCNRALEAVINITYSGTKDLHNYPVKVELTPEWKGWGFVTSNGSNIYFVDDPLKPLYYWIEKWDYSSKQAIIWVKVPLIKTHTVTRLYMCITTNGSNPYLSYNDPRKVFPFFVNPSTSNTGEWTQEKQDHPRCGWWRPARFEFYKEDGEKFVLKITFDRSCITYVNEAFYVIHTLALNPGTYKIHAELYYSYPESGNYGTSGHKMRIWVGSLLILDQSWSSVGWKLIDKTFTLRDTVTAFKIGTYWSKVVTYDISSSDDGFSTIYIRPLAKPEPLVTIGNPS